MFPFKDARLGKVYRVPPFSYHGSWNLFNSGLGAPLPCMALVFVPEVGLACHWIPIRQSPGPSPVRADHTVPHHTIRFERQVLDGTCVLLVVVLAYKFLPLPLPPPQVPFYNRCRFFFSFLTTQNTSLLFFSDFLFVYAPLFWLSCFSVSRRSLFHILSVCRLRLHTHSLSGLLSQSSLFVAQYLHYTFATTNVPQLLLLSVLGNKLLTLYRASYCMS